MNSDENKFENTTPMRSSPSFMSAPILALIGTPVNLMSPAERQAFLQRVRAMRTSPQTLAAQLRSEAPEDEENPRRKTRKTTETKSAAKTADLENKYGDLL